MFQMQMNEIIFNLFIVLNRATTNILIVNKQSGF